MNWCCFGNFRKKKDDPQNEITGFSSEKNIKLFSYNELRSATDNFHRDHKIGRGGFGTVYKGTLRTGQEVAVKVLSAESRQGIREFLTEIDVITNVKHPHLVELLGCCIQDNNRILVYEYLQNSSLDHALLEYAWHGQLTKKADMYSFGIVILEIISGKSSSRALLSEDGQLLLERAWQLYQEDRLKELVDSALEEYPEEEVTRYMKVALFCTQASAMRRPGMLQVVEMLSRPLRLNEKELTPPGFINDYNSIRNNAKMGTGTSSTNYPFKTMSSVEDTAPFTSNSVSYTEVIPR
ncbi:LRR receptor-like serine/threonine-protein kinase [Carex littledalei]|uniref:LRR receptor-like serine/threonine-protein kinase n=1 Tax=Carex littledalei TaxID=544730 RepID=A0A833RI15_9POAL|nr:LRR receptor-like serine/threonine-protein kinase [Carex littledalei]